MAEVGSEATVLFKRMNCKPEPYFPFGDIKALLSDDFVIVVAVVINSLLLCSYAGLFADCARVNVFLPSC